MADNGPRRFARRVRIKTWSAKTCAEALQNYARKGNAEWVADILAETAYSGLNDLLSPEWWGPKDVNQLRVGRKLVEDLFSEVPTQRHDDMKAGVTALGHAIVRALAKSRPRLKLRK